MSKYNDELYQEMMENEVEEQPQYYEEENVFSCVFNQVMDNYYD